MKTKKEVMFGALIVMMLFSLTFVSSFSVGMPYMEDKQLYLQPGDVKDLEFILQNSGGTENSNAKARVVEGIGVIKLVDSSDVYLVVPGEQTPVNFKVTIPANAKLGDSYHIKLDFAAQAGTGGFSFGSAIEQNFDIIIGDRPVPVVEQESEPEELSNLWIYLILAMIIVGIVVVVFVKRKK